MATVQSLTKDRLVALEDATVVDGYINGSGHLILVTHDATEIDAGYALVAVPDASTTVRGAVELATQAETLTGSDTTRAVTPAGLVGSITTDKLVDDAVTVDKLANNSVGTSQLIDSNVTAAKLATDSVTTAKIVDSNVTSGKLASNSVTTVKITDANVTTAKIADSNVTTGKIADANITVAKLSAAVLELIPRSVAYVRVPTPSYTNNTNAYQDLGSSFSGNKVSSNTRLRVEIGGTCYASTQFVACIFGIRVDGTDYDVCEIGGANNVESQHGTFHGVAWLPNTLPTGSLSFQLRGRGDSNGPIINLDTNDWYYADIIEMP